jgi:DNA modification methylase
VNKLINLLKKNIKNKYYSKTLQGRDSIHILIKGDCKTIYEMIPTNSIDLVITDPPYNFGINYGGNFNDRKKWSDYFDWLKKRLKGIENILSNKGTFYLISYPEISARLLPFIEDEMKLTFKRWITWHYPSNIGHSKKNFTRSQRSILFFTKNKKDYIFNRKYLIQHYKNPTVKKIKKRIKSGSKGRAAYDLLRFVDLIELQKGLIDVIDVNLLKNNSKERFRNLTNKFKSMTSKELKKYDHPCQLPISLLEILIKVSSKSSSIILDPFAGSYTTSSAALRNDRNSIGIELNKKYVDFGYKRLALDQKTKIDLMKTIV